MAEDGRNARKNLIDLARDAASTQLTLSREYSELSQLMLSPDVDRGAAGQVYVRSVLRETESYWRGLADLSIDYGTAVLSLQSTVARAVVNDVLSEVTTPRSTETTEPGPARRTATRRPAGPDADEDATP